MASRTNHLRKLKLFLRIVLGKRWLSNRVLFVKALMFNFYSIIATFLISFAITGSMQYSVGISLLDFLGKTLLYFVFDVSWNNLMKKM
jgi:hypothetical protein